MAEQPTTPNDGGEPPVRPPTDSVPGQPADPGPGRPAGPREPGFDRRSFFRQLLLKGLDRAEQEQKRIAARFAAAFEATQAEVEKIDRSLGALADRSAKEPGLEPEDAIPRGGALDHPPDPRVSRYLQPPGAKSDFADVCSRCGECQRVCPAQCIQMDGNLNAGLPYIVARESPCVICDELACMTHCPTQALSLVERTAIRMGRAEMDYQRCLRNPVTSTGEDCRICVTQCPIGATALAIGSDGRVEVRPGCTGCGVCEHACPTDPASIVIIPAGVR